MLIRRFLAATVGAVLAASSAYAYFGGPAAFFAGSAGKPGIPLAAGTYVIEAGANAVDGGGAVTPWVSYKPTVVTSAAQQWIWNGSRLSNSSIAGGGGGSQLLFDTARNNVSYATISPDGLTATSAGATDKGVFTKPTQATGKYNFRIQLVNCVTNGSGQDDCAIGLASSAMLQTDGYVGQLTTSFAVYNGNGDVYLNNGPIGTVAGFVNGDTVDVAVDFGAKLVWFRTNAGNWNGPTNGNPTTGAGGISISALTGTAWSPAVNIHLSGDQYTIQAAPVISGYTAWGAGAGGAPGPYLIESGTNVPTLDASGDTYSIFSAPPSGYKVRDNRTGDYLGLNVSNALVFSTVQTVWTMVPAGPHPVSITFSPVSPVSVADTAVIHQVFTTAHVNMSDGSTFTGTITTSDTTLFEIAGMNIQAKRALTGADDGNHTTTITAVP